MGRDGIGDEEELLFGSMGRFLKFSRGLVVFIDASIVRELDSSGPAFGCLVLNGEKRECGSITPLVLGL